MEPHIDERGSVSRMLQLIRVGDDAAAAELWRRCFPKLLAIARRSLHCLPHRQEDAEDAAPSAMISFWKKLMFADEALSAGLAEQPDQRPSLAKLADNVEGQPQPPPPSALPLARYWSEGLEVPFKQSHYRILSRLGSGSFGTTFKVAHIDGGQEVGTFAAKVVFDRESGARSLGAFRNARQHSKHPSLATIFEINSDWTENSFVALMDWVDGTPLSEWVGLVIAQNDARP